MANTIISNNKLTNTPSTNTPSTNTPSTNTPSTNTPSTNKPSTNKPSTNANKNTASNVNKNITKKLNAPEINNTKKELSINNTISAYKNNTQKSETIKTTQEEMVEYGNVITNNYMLLLGVTSALIICIIIYFLSETFRVGRICSAMLAYQGFQRITSIDYIKLGDLRLGDMYVSSAYNAAHSGYQMYDYTSKKIVLSLLQSGVRYFEFNVFNSTFGNTAYPVVSMGYKTGEWKMMITDTPLESIFEIIVNNAFKVNDGIEGAFNPDDPVFIGLNLNTNSNLSCLNLIGFLITKYFRDRLLPNDYSFQNSDSIADIKLAELMGKVIFFASDGFQGSGLEEIINYSWDNIDNNSNHKMQRIHYSTLIEPGFNELQLIEFNKTGLTIVVPHKEGDFYNTNYEPTKAFELGCQFVAMEFQYIDSNMNMYITKFKNKALILKDASLQKRTTSSSSSSKTTTTKPATTKPATTQPSTRQPSITQVSKFEDIEEQDLENPARKFSEKTRELEGLKPSNLENPARKAAFKKSRAKKQDLANPARKFSAKSRI